MGLLLCESETWGGRLFAVACVLLFAAGCCLLRWIYVASRTKSLDVEQGGAVGTPRPTLLRATICFICATVACMVVCYALSPSGRTAAGAKLQSVFPPGTHY